MTRPLHRAFREASSTMQWLLLLALLYSSSFRQVSASVPVYIQQIELYTTHEWIFTKPEVYFQCEGEPQKFLTGVTLSNKLYNFTFHESFQPLTELEVPKCKRCGLFERDFFTEDDVFDRFELCPLDFSEPPEGKLIWDALNQMNITLKCPQCNTRNSFASGVIFEPDASSSSGFIFIFAVALSSGLTISLIVVLLAYCIKEGRLPFVRQQVPSDAKFMEMHHEDDDEDWLDDVEDDIELAEQGARGKAE